MNVLKELHTLKMKVLKTRLIANDLKKELVNEIFQIETEIALNYTRCCKSGSEQLKVLGEHIAEQFDHKAEDVIE